LSQLSDKIVECSLKVIENFETFVEGEQIVIAPA